MGPVPGEEALPWVWKLLLTEVNPREEASVVSPSAVSILGSWGNECLVSEGVLVVYHSIHYCRTGVKFPRIIFLCFILSVSQTKHH